MADRITFAPEFKQEVQEWMKANPQKTRVATIAAAAEQFKNKARSKDGKKVKDPSIATLGLWYNGVAEPKRRGKAKASTAKRGAGRGRRRSETPVSQAISKTSSRLIDQVRDLEQRIHGEIVDGLKNLKQLQDQLALKLSEYETMFNRRAEDVLAKNQEFRELLGRIGRTTATRAASAPAAAAAAPKRRGRKPKATATGAAAARK
jgi:hypothetical protein